MHIYLPSAHAPSGDRECRAAQWLEENGLPHRKLEHWRMTPIHRLLQQEFTVSPDIAPTGAEAVIAEYRERFALQSGVLLVMFHGGYRPDLSDFAPEKITGLSLETAQESALALDYARLPFAAQNLSHATTETLTLDVAAAYDFAYAIHVLCLYPAANAQASFGRIQVRVAGGARMCLVETL
ncbi:MAG: hypothetical protein HRT36_07495, partial [Alphaproteobacteria bacterium]|nr:hypothetical protein [Alphaproteobacteria bacterium]